LAEGLRGSIFKRFEQLTFLNIRYVVGCAFAVLEDRPDGFDAGVYSYSRADESVKATAVAEIMKNLTRVETRKVDPADIRILCKDGGANEGEGR